MEGGEPLSNGEGDFHGLFEGEVFPTSLVAINPVLHGSILATRSKERES